MSTNNKILKSMCVCRRAGVDCYSTQHVQRYSTLVFAVKETLFLARNWALDTCFVQLVGDHGAPKTIDNFACCFQIWKLSIAYVLYQPTKNGDQRRKRRQLERRGVL